ncbi:ABC transporter substrate-binding protein, partial [Candidatus Poribacteria bacterium]|nr:ABC transporter substrate-binding protein [Candidatus Poribacteria bacterium]
MYTRKFIFVFILILLLLSASKVYSAVRLTYAELNDVTQYDPLSFRIDNTSLRFATLLFNKLVGTNTDLRLQPELLESLETESRSKDRDRDVLRFRIRKLRRDGKTENIKWVCCKRNGEVKIVRDLSADDIIYTFNRIKNEPTFYDNVTETIAEIRAVSNDNSLIDLVLTYSASRRPDKMDLLYKALRFPIVFDKSMGDYNDCKKIGNEVIIGTGPFVIRDSYPNTVVLTKNPYYFKDSPTILIPDSQLIDELVMVYYRDSLPAVQDLLAGKIDMIVELPLQYYGWVKNTKEIGLSLHGTNNFSFFAYNCLNPFNDLKIRQAFTYAIDRKQMFINIYGEIFPGLQDEPLEKIKQILHSPLPYSETPVDIAPLEYNPDKAKSLKNQSGFSKREIALLAYIGEVDDDRICRDFGQYIKDELGVSVKIQKISKPEWNKKFLDRDFEVAYGKWTFQEDANIIQSLFSNSS